MKPQKTSFALILAENSGSVLTTTASKVELIYIRLVEYKRSAQNHIAASDLDFAKTPSLKRRITFLQLPFRQSLRR
jgi:hypothetical protein